MMIYVVRSDLISKFLWSLRNPPAQVTGRRQRAPAAHLRALRAQRQDARRGRSTPPCHSKVQLEPKKYNNLRSRKIHIMTFLL